jgi:hypothetical protein
MATNTIPRNSLRTFPREIRDQIYDLILLEHKQRMHCGSRYPLFFTCAPTDLHPLTSPQYHIAGLTFQPPAFETALLQEGAHDLHMEFLMLRIRHSVFLSCPRIIRVVLSRTLLAQQSLLHSHFRRDAPRVIQENIRVIQFGTRWVFMN